ncbi:MAG: NAD(+)/NADH kinase, partial [Bacteroidota bacterium]
MKIALYGKAFNESFTKSISLLIRKLEEVNAEILLHQKFASFLVGEAGIKPKKYEEFNKETGIPDDTDFLFSLGGDGTFLDTVSIIKDKSIPVLGINTGRLGFLANISKEEIGDAMDFLFNGEYSLEERSLIRLRTSEGVLDDFCFALNEITIHKQNASMITINTRVDDEFLNSYWADGLIISTP